MYGRRMATRKHEEEPFDKCTSEYYSCGRKGSQNRKAALEPLPNLMHNADDPPAGGNAHGHLSSVSDTDGSGMSCTEADAHEWHGISCGYSAPLLQKEDSLEQRVEQCPENGLPIQHPTEGCKPEVFETSEFTAELSPTFGLSGDHRRNNNTILRADIPGGNSSTSSSNGECVHNFASVCEWLGSQRGPTEEEMRWGVVGASVLCQARGASGGHRRTFPPPLSSVAMQSYSDRRGYSPPSTCTAGGGYCLRSLRCNGRFLLQEVKAPTHKYFRVSREHGRLKLEMIIAESDLSTEEDEEASVSSADDACVGKADKLNAVSLAEDAESSHALEVCAEDAFIGSTHSPTPHDEPTCVASSSHAELMSLESRAGDSADRYERMLEQADMPGVGMMRPLMKHTVPKALSASEMRITMLPESPSSPMCIEMKRALYSGPSSSIKSRRVRPISAF